MARPVQAAPEPKMTSTKAAILLSVAVIFDFLKFIFVSFIFSAPVLIGAASALYAAQNPWLSWIPSSWVVAAVGGTAGVTELIPGVAEVVEFFGIMMAMCVAFAGWVLFTFLFLTWRISFFAHGATRFMWALGGAIVSLIPIIDMLPSFTPSIWGIIRDQRKEDTEFRKKFEAQSRQALLTSRMRIAEQQARHAEREAEIEQNEIPEGVARAA